MADADLPGTPSRAGSGSQGEGSAFVQWQAIIEAFASYDREVDGVDSRTQEDRDKEVEAQVDKVLASFHDQVQAALQAKVKNRKVGSVTVFKYNAQKDDLFLSSQTLKRLAAVLREMGLIVSPRWDEDGNQGITVSLDDVLRVAKKSIGSDRIAPTEDPP